MRYSIEAARPSDRDAILEVMRVWNMHHIPSVEMPKLDIDAFFVARLQDGRVIGAAGYEILSPVKGKTTLLGVYPEFQGMGVGKALQNRRLEAMAERGVKEVLTNADRPDIIVWYKKHFGYEEVGKLKKRCAFGLCDESHWTTLRMDLERYVATKEEKEARISNYIATYDPSPLHPYEPLIINVCLTGMTPTKMVNPHVPLSVDEIVEQAIRVCDLGASIVHLHARDEQGVPTPDARYYEKIITAIRREREDLVCCVTTSGRNWSDFERRAEVLHLTGDAKPDMASLTLGSLNFLTGASVNPITTIERLAMTMKERKIKPELEIFDSGMVNLAKYLERHEIIGGRKYFNILLGNINTAPATIGSLAQLADALPADSLWAAAGLGGFQLPMNAAAIAAGGHVRVGLEDNLFYDYEKEEPATNEMLVERVVEMAKILQRPIATPKKAREMLEL
ncbi:GNAT family N-acetyltransferase [Hydrogenimonas sp.]